MTLWLFALALTVGALLFLLPVLLEPPAQHDDPPVTDVYRDQLRELDADLATGRITAAAHALARAELQQRVLEDHAHRGKTAAPAASGLRGLALTLGALIPACATLIYLQVGSPAAIAGGENQSGRERIAATTPAPAQKTATSTTADAGASVSGTVSIAGELARELAAGDVLFVFARAPEGPPMPLAVLRVSNPRLPLRFTLDDSLAMTPEFRLSMHREVSVQARLSKSGNARPGSGDLQSPVLRVKTGTAGITLSIRERIP